MAKKKKNKFYAFKTPSEEGVVTSWPACEAKVKGKQARYKGFPTQKEADDWLSAGARYENKALKKKIQQSSLPQNAIFFDAGTGRGVGTEVRVTDRAGTPLTFMALEKDQVTPEGNLLLSDKTNNYGELMGCYLALQIAETLDCKVIMGDSRLVVDYWSKGYLRRETAGKDPDLQRLVHEVKKLRRTFEARGGAVKHVSGSINPADLGFHKD